MKKMTFVLLFVVSFWGGVQAGEFKKPYFSSTRPGAWAKYEMVNKDGSKIIYTYKRLANSEGRVVYEHTNFVSSGPGEGVTATTLYVLEPGFDFDRNMLSYGKAIQAMIAQNNGGPPNVTPPRVIKMIRNGSLDFSNSLEFINKEKVGKHQCDHYTYNVTSGGPRPMTHIGNLWLNEKLPFGVVKQSAKIKDDSKIVGDFTLRLLEFGSEAKGVSALLDKIPKAEKRIVKKQPAKASINTYTLEEAYENEKVQLIVEIKEETGGRRLSMIIKNKTTSQFMLILPEGTMAFKAGTPINTLNIYNNSENRIKLNPSDSAPAIELGQTGKRGVLKGRFELTMYKGEPLYMGSVTIGSFK